jgi:Delta3-Delta2-enoyl-CoA isomerase
VSGPLRVEAVGAVRVVHWDDNENRFRGPSVAAWHGVLDELEGIEGPLAVVVVGTGKFFSNGLDLEWISSAEDPSGFMADVHRLLGRMLLFPAYTVAALNGHTFAAGAMLSSTFDRRIMRADRGYWCLPEVDLGLPLTPAMYATVAAHLPQATLAEATLTGRRYGGEDAVVAGIAAAAAPEGEVLERAVAVAATMADKDRAVLRAHKELLYGDALRTCGV